MIARDWTDVSEEEMRELERAAADEDGDEVIPAERFFAELGIAWPPPPSQRRLRQ